MVASRVARFVAAKEWPDVQSQKKYADGAFWFSCAGHGGTVVMLDRFSDEAKAVLREAGVVQKVVQNGRRLLYGRDWVLDGYEGVEVAVGEEDCEWALLFVADPGLSAGYQKVGASWLGDSDVHADAVASAKSWNPDAYTALTGETVAEEESHVLQRRRFEAENADNYVTRAAWGDWHEKVPAGQVGVVATRKSDGDERFFLVSKDEYATRDGSFVVDTDRHKTFEGVR